MTDKAERLRRLAADVAGCTKCTELGKLEPKRNPVFDKDGNPNATLVFIGQSPGKDENDQGTPLVGEKTNQAGFFLKEILAEMQPKFPSLKLDPSREDVFVCNTICCWPPKNPKGTGDLMPTCDSDEVKNCRDFLKRTLDIIKPKFICCLGVLASQNLLRKKGKPLQSKGVDVLRGVHKGRLVKGEFEKLPDEITKEEFDKFDDRVTVVCTYHPTGPSWKKKQEKIRKDIPKLINEMKAAVLK